MIELVVGFVAGIVVGWAVRNWTFKSSLGKALKKEIDKKIK